ncbi:hypothetical protein JL722_9449 [Aureococcus anophagefferens]|nr:hypothetical protein JL722_9449 [Aureococcus anophagefferens]
MVDRCRLVRRWVCALLLLASQARSEDGSGFARKFVVEGMLQELPTLGSDRMLKVAASPAKRSGTIRKSGCDAFEHGALPFICEVELPEHFLVRKHLPRNATVLEFGGRFGTTTCQIAEVQGNSGRLAVVEPDEGVWAHLEANLRKNDCAATVVKGVVGSGGMKVMGRGYGGRVVPDAAASHNAVAYLDLERSAGFSFDTLLVDCEGCMRFMRDQLDPVIISGQIRQILLEEDMSCAFEERLCMDYEPWFAFLRQNGFRRAAEYNDCNGKLFHAKDSGKWCQSKLVHSVWLHHTHHHNHLPP